jgi:type VI secretion system protein ImpH
MAAEAGGADPGLSAGLFREGHRYDFFQAVRMLERLASARARGGPAARLPVGRDHPPGREVARFRVLPSLSFPAGDVGQVRPPAPSENGAATPPEVVVSFFGLTGPGGALPHHYTTLLLRRVREKDFALRDFFDLFNHRLVSLFYRVWEKYRLPFAYERARLAPDADGPDLATLGLYCLTGFGTAGLRGRLDVDDEAFLYYSGHFAHYPRPAVALQDVLEDYFGVPAEVKQLQGQWLRLDPDDRSALPGPALPEGLNVQLGVNVVVGDRCWDVQGKFRLRVGPLRYAAFRRLMPDGDALRPLAQMARTFAGAEFDFDVQLVLEPAEVPACRLGGDAGAGSYLGWNAWVRGEELTRPVDDAVFALESV